jgi:hypothetical protein
MVRAQLHAVGRDATDARPGTSRICRVDDSGRAASHATR